MRRKRPKRLNVAQNKNERGIGTSKIFGSVSEPSEDGVAVEEEVTEHITTMIGAHLGTRGLRLHDDDNLHMGLTIVGLHRAITSIHISLVTETGEDMTTAVDRLLLDGHPADHRRAQGHLQDVTKMMT